MKRIKINILLSCAFFYVTINAQNLKLAEIFNDGAVLQRNSKVTLWGYSTKESLVNITIQNKQFQTKTDKQGKWNVDLSSLKEGGPFSMKVISAFDTIKLNNIFVGEVWVAGGQSNMAFPLRSAAGGKDEILTVNHNIHFVMIPYKPYEDFKIKGDMNWYAASSDNVASISAVAYYFAKVLQQKLNVPVGIICCYKGGSYAETWMSRNWLLRNTETSPIVDSYDNYIAKLGKEKYDGQYADFELKTKVYQDSLKSGFSIAKVPKEPMGEKHFNRPAALYHNMLEQIMPYSVKGVIWYQGEQNAGRAHQYRTLFPLLIDEWRNDFKNPDMPFIFVQLTNYGKNVSNNNSTWAEMREAQLFTWQKVKNTGMAVTIDVGDKDNIHPIQKEPVGKRLAASALNTVYGFNIPYSGPVYKSVEFKGNTAILTFDFVYEGLVAKDELKGFTICGSDKNFVSAKAEIKNNQVIVYNENISSPVAVRYAWANSTDGNLFNKANFPATPFRTDDFKSVTDEKKSDL